MRGNAMKFATLGPFVGILLLAGAPARAAGPIRIGVVGPFTGGSAAMGISMRQGIELAAAEINEAGGVLGRPLVLIERNDEADNNRGARIARQLTEHGAVDAAVGFVNTGVALAALPYFEQARIPLILSVTTGSVLTREFAPPEYAENYVFRVAASTAVEVDKIVALVTARGYRRVAIFADTTSYGHVVRHDLLRALAAHGLTPVANEKFNIGDRDMTAQLGRARRAGAEVILTYGIGPELAAIANGRAALGWKVPIIGSWTLSMSSFIDAAGRNGAGAIMPQTFIEDGATPRQAAFIRHFHAVTHTERMDSPPSAAQGYDSLILLAAAIREAGTLDGPKIRAALEDLRQPVAGVVQVYRHPFDRVNHEAVAAANVAYGIVKDGRVVRLSAQQFVETR
jgi:branched-chain amino acid transport system substrate-binding protein